MKYLSELLQVYSNFAKMVETQFSKQTKIFRSDNAILNMLSKLLCIPMTLFINQLVQVPLSKIVESNENFVIFLTLFVLSFFLPKFLLLF